MARFVRPSIRTRFALRRLPARFAVGIFLSLALAGCATKRPRVPPPEPSASTVVKAETTALPTAKPADSQVIQASANEPPTAEAADFPIDDDFAIRPDDQVLFTLPAAIDFALDNNPRLRSARAAILRASGAEQAAFAPFLPQVDLLTQLGAVSSTLAPGVPGTEGFILSSGTGTRTYAQAELGLQWMLYDFGRISGRHMQAVWREQIAEFQLVRARQTVEFDVSATYLDVLLANASRRVEEDAVRRAEAILHDTSARRQNGDALREDVLRAEVQLSESRENLIRAREREYDALARLNNVMGRNSTMPLKVTDLALEPPLPGTLGDLLAEAASLRPEIRIAQQSVAAAQAGRSVAEADFLPEVFVRAAGARVDGEYVVTGWQQGAGLHLISPVFDGGKRRGELRSANAEVQAALADAANILDNISLQVNVAYRGMMASRECIALSRTAVSQAEENLRIMTVSYRNGNATPTDIVDSEAALTRAQQRYYQSTFNYLAALARIDYVTGRNQTTLPAAEALNPAEELPIQFPDQADTMTTPVRPSPQRLPDVPSTQE
jgi:outer membrane protein